ncbi:hypothetical protein AGMMS49944_16760 [Spirochaetia bacterium]|nr:hypothetical protein AGMMS49944_16760 [Spirochaetia bacterium]
MDEKKYTSALENLHVLVNLAEKKATAESFSEVADELKKLWKQLRKIRTLADGKRPPVVGVFGCPSRGKSFLLNVLMGEDILPKSPITGTTRCAIEISHTSGEKAVLKQCFFTKKMPQSEDLSINSLRQKLEAFSENTAKDIQDIEKLEIRIPSKSLLDDDIVLMDTPGAEAGIEAEETNLLEDTKRAVDMLAEADVVLFCMRADLLGANTDGRFYKKHIENLKPINIIGFRDAAKDETEDRLIADAAKKYRLDTDNTCVISALETHEALEKWKIEHRTNPELSLDSVLEAGNMQGLRKLILNQIASKEERIVEVKLRAVLRQYNDCVEEAYKKENIDLLPAKVYVANLYQSLKDTSNSSLVKNFEECLKKETFDSLKLYEGEK